MKISPRQPRWTVVVVLVLASRIFQPASAQSPANEEQNRLVVSRHYELLNQGNWRAAAALFAEDARHDGLRAGILAFTRTLEDIYTTFPDWKMEILEMASEGESVIVRSRVSGTHLGIGRTGASGGLLTGVAPTGKRFVVQHIHWYKIRDGKIADHYSTREDLAMLQQLGLVPPGARPPPQSPPVQTR
jgi:steroid delta-isomerase-like uncharacterized protein